MTEHEKRMQEIIKSANRREQKKIGKPRRRWRWMVMNIAAVIGALYFIAIILVFTVPTVRIAAKDYCLMIDTKRTEAQAAKEELAKEVYNYPMYIPEGFVIEEMLERDVDLVVRYVNNEGKEIHMTRHCGDKPMEIHVEWPDGDKDIYINGKRSSLIYKGDQIIVGYRNKDCWFILITYIGEKETIKILESIKERE